MAAVGLTKAASAAKMPPKISRTTPTIMYPMAKQGRGDVKLVVVQPLLREFLFAQRSPGAWGERGGTGGARETTSEAQGRG